MRRSLLAGAALVLTAPLAGACTSSDGSTVSRQPPLGTDSGYVQTDDGVRLFYRTVGDGPVQILVPVALYLDDALRPLAAADRRLVFYDPRARGRSDAGDRARITLDRQVADVEAIRTGLGIDSMAVIGWSGLGMELAVYAMRYPERVTRLVQVAPVAARDEPHNRNAYAARRTRIDTAALGALTAAWTRGEFDGESIDYCRALARITGVANFADPALAARVPDTCVHPNEQPDSLAILFGSLLASFAGYDWRDRLDALTMPRLVVHGLADAFPVEGSREWVPEGSTASLLVIERAGHFPFLERPDVFFPAVDSFLRGTR